MRKGQKKWINHSINLDSKLIRNSLINQNRFFPFMRYKDNIIFSHTKFFSVFFKKNFIFVKWL